MGKEQCSGYTKQHKRCERELNNYHDTDKPLYCPHHKDKNLSSTSEPVQASHDIAAAARPPPELSSRLQVIIDAVRNKQPEHSEFLHDFVYHHPEDKKLNLIRNEDLAKEYIDPSLSPTTQSELLELITKPASDADEPGFIYCYQHKTDTSTGGMISDLLEQISADPVDTLTKELADLDIATNEDIPNEHLSAVLYKVGKAVNVKKRMNEWSRKCRIPIDLLDVFPEQPPELKAQFTMDEDSESVSNEEFKTYDFPSAIRTPKADRVESLIHAHLKDESFGNVPFQCNCGTEHREWFKDKDGIHWPHTNIRLVIQYYIKLVKLMYEVE
ncbi:DUF1766-domain-containing protein [Ramicandelaber brevisporus]|nr:DUF1766-domain-containing protein [Ramicandelaber brevisporus]